MTTKTKTRSKSTTAPNRKGAVVIYPRALALMGEKKDGKKYKHDFDQRVPILGLPDGSILIPAGKRPLWGTV